MLQRFSTSNLHSWGPAFCIAVALLVVLLLGGWGAHQDWQYIRQTELRTEVTRVRSHAERTVGYAERRMSALGTSQSLFEVARETWLREHWGRFIPPPDLIYGAVADNHGTILSHSDLPLEGGQLCPDWNAQPVPDAGPEVYATNCRSLTTGLMAMDVVVKIQQEGRVVGSYHIGVSQEWMDQQIAAARYRNAFGWAAVIGGNITVVLLSSISLYLITSRSVRLEKALRKAQTQRLSELNQLVVGLAHEVRNPLNAIQLNLYTTDRIFRGDVELDADEVSRMLSESGREVQRVDRLMTLLLGYARADAIEMTTVDVGREIRNVAQFLGDTLQASGIQLEIDVPDDVECHTRAGRGQVRQILLNLLNNAQDSVPANTGQIQIVLRRNGKLIEVTVRDNGGGIPLEYRDRLFSPFFSTKAHGTGLGLALVRSLMERSGGHAECVRADPGQCEFRVTWPAECDPDTSERPAS